MSASVVAEDAEHIPDISIIIPLYNCEDYIEETLHSILRHLNVAKTEIIVVDDQSSDAGPEKVKQLIAEHSNIILLSNSFGKGVSSARNCGIASAKGQYIGFLDADDVLLGNQTQRKLQFALDNQVDVITSDFIRFNDGDSVDDSASTPAGNYASNLDYAMHLQSSNSDWVVIDDPIHTFLSTGCMIWTGCILIRRALISELNLTFNIQLKNSEDDDFWYRICLGRSLTFWKHVTTGYRIREVSASSEPLKKHLGVLYFRRLLLNDSTFKHYKVDIQRKYQQDFTKFAILCAKHAEVKTFWREMALFKSNYFMNDKHTFIADQRLKFLVRLVKFKFSTKGKQNGV